VAKQKRQRQRDSRQTRQTVVLARRRKEQRKRLVTAVVAAAMLVLGISVFVGSGGRDQDVATTNTTTVRTPVSLAAVSPGATITGDTPCPRADGTSERTTQFAKPPPMCINPARAYTAQVSTSKGSFTITLDPKASPNTVNNFVVLARYHFYDGIPFHRVVPGFVVQGGDPLASGLGGPGYKFNDELPKAPYKIGSVAMANSGANTNSNGSQFFIITGQAGANLGLNYNLLGEVTEGLSVVKSIEAVGSPESGADPNGGKPTEEVKILSITIRET
jgi:cyclophilin family peptidyl-prolyl cis-trans isomerase